MFSWRQFCFFLLFFGLFFLLGLFSETDWSLCLMAAFTLLFFCYQDWLDFSPSKDVLKYSSWWIGMILISFLSFFHTLSIPLTFYRFVFFVFSAMCFVFFLFLKRKKLPFEFLSKGFIVVSVVMTFLSLCLLLFPQLIQYLPSTNLLAANYGHNHAGAIFLLTLPLAWYSALKNPSSIKSFSYFFIIMAGLLLTFGRVLIFLGLIEVIFLIWSARQRLSRQVLQYVMFPLLFLFIGVLGMFVTLTAWTDSGHACPLPQLRVQVCKSLVFEGRFHYWTQAWHTFTRAPLTGFGGGTFGLLSQQSTRQAGEYSAYAHNEYLQIFAEFGVVGGVWFAAGCLYFAYKHLWPTLKTSRQLTFYWAVGLLFMSIDAFFDYNWNLLMVWVFMLIGAAMLIREKHEKTSA